MFYGLALVMIALLLSYPLSGLFVKNSDSSPEAYYQQNIYKYAMTFGNYGFMGNFIILGIWGGEGLFKYQMLTFFIGIVCHSWGIYILIPKESGNRSIWQNLLKAIKTPPVVALILGIMLGLINAQQYCPDFVMNALSNTSKCMGPVAMILAGFVIGGYKFKSLFLNKKVYAATFLRLIVIPAFMAVILKLLNVNEEIITLALIAFATPLGLNTIVFPATYGGDTKTGASMAMISHAMSVITLPLMYYLFIVDKYFPF